MRIRSNTRWVALFGLGIVLGCGDDGSSTGGGGPVGAGGAGGNGAGGAEGGGGEGQTCDGHRTEGAPSFSDETASWGLGGVNGARLMSGDLNGDGYPDMIVHGFAPNTREVIGSDTRLVYVFMNEAEGSGRTFVDRTYESGFARPVDDSKTELKASHMAVLGDVDGDGDLDVFSGTYSESSDDTLPGQTDRSEIYLNDGAGNFTLVPDSGVAFDAARRTSSATFADVNGDGILDLFVGVHYSATQSLQAGALFYGNGDGTFEDVTAASNVNSERRATFGATSCDLDDDGSPELLMSAYARGPNVLFSWVGDEMEDFGESSNVAFDENQDFTDNQNFLCYCTVNESDEDCAGVDSPSIQCPDPAGAYWGISEQQPKRLGGNTFSTVCRDIDGDGRQDLYEVDIAHWWAGQSSDGSNVLYNRTESPKEFSFERGDREALGLDVPHVGVDWNEGGIVGAAADLNGDAYVDLLLGTSDYPDQFGWIYTQKTDGSFDEVGEDLGLHHPCAVGMTIADFDRDGDLDVVVASGTARDCAEIWSTNEVHFYENGGEAQNGWLAIDLSAPTLSNSSAIGATVTVESGGVTQVQQVTSGYGHFGLQNDSTLFFALGDCATADRVTVTWPDAERSGSEFLNVPSGQVVRLTQGEVEVETVLP